MLEFPGVRADRREIWLLQVLSLRNGMKASAAKMILLPNNNRFRVERELSVCNP